MYRLICRAALVAATVGASTLVLPGPAQPAATAAVVRGEVHVVLAANHGFGSDGIYRRTPGSAVATVLVPESANPQIHDVTTSADGSRFAYIADTLDAHDNPTHSKVVVRDISGRLVRVVEDYEVPSPDSGNLAPTLSPDGRTVVWSRFSVKSGHFSLALRKAAVAAGPAANIAGSSGFYGPEFLNAGTIIVGTLISDTVAGNPRTLPLTGGTSTTVAGLKPGAWGFAVSPSGTKLSWAFIDVRSGGSDIQVGNLALSGGAASVSNTTTFAADFDSQSPTFSRDGSRLSFIRTAQLPLNVFTGPVDKSRPPVADPATPGDEFEVSRGFVDRVRPGTATPRPFTPAGRSATLRWTLPTDTDLSGVVVTRTAAGLTPVTTYIPAPLTTLAQTGLVLGKTYTYAITAVDHSGNRAAPTSRSMTAIGATTTFADPTSRSARTAPFAVTIGKGAPSTARFTVSYRTNGSSAYSPWLSNVAPGVRTFGATSSTGVACTTSTPGNSYTFRVQGFDSHGNTTAATTGGTAVVPYDQTTATFSSGVVTSSPDRWYGTANVFKLKGAYARLSVAGNRFQIIGERCKTCGVFDVYDNNTVVGTVDSKGTRAPRTLLLTHTLTSGTHVLIIKTRGTTGRPNVVLDAFAVRR